MTVYISEIVHNTIQDQCDCPTACHYSVFDPTVSYASTSDYASERKLSTVSTTLLQQKVLNSREVSHRMEKRKFEIFKTLILNFEHSFDEVNRIVRHILEKISIQLKLIDARYKADNAAWNRKNFLFKFQIYNIEKNFIRPRDAMEERTLSNICVGFYEFVFMVEANLKHLQSNTTFGETARSIMYATTIDAIQSQIETTERALSNVTQLYEAYQNGMPIFKYKYGKTSRRHNVHIVPKKLLADSLTHNYYARHYAPRLKTDIKKITTQLQNYKLLLKEVKNTNHLNRTTMKTLSGLYIDACEDYYHSKSVFYAECIERPKKIVEQSYEKFKEYISNYMDTKEFIVGNLNNLEDSLINLIGSEVLNIYGSIHDLTVYLRVNSTSSKDHLADIVLSDDLRTQLSYCETIFQEIRNRGQNIYDGWTELMTKITDIWKPIIEDDQMIHYYKYRKYKSFLVNFTEFYNETHMHILEARNTNDLRQIIGDADKMLEHDFEALRNHLRSFKSSINIDELFLR